MPQLHLHDSVYQALQYMADFHVRHLPVVLEEKFIGLVSEEILMDALDENLTMEQIREHFLMYAVPADHHLFETAAKMSEYQITTIPVVDNEMIFLGSITNTDLLQQISRLVGAGDKGALIVLAMDKQDFSFSELTRLIETNDAYITQLNTYTQPGTGEFQVIIRINKFEVSDILATLQRFEYQIKYHFGEERFENELKNNYEHLMNYLNI